MQPGAHFSFELTGNHGAALMTRYPTYMEDALLESMFAKYIKRHYESWVAFARSEGYGDDVQPVLVTGFDITRDFAMLAYSNQGVFLEAGSDVDVPMLASAHASIWVTRHTRCSPHFKSGPQSWELSPIGRTIDFPSSQLANSRTIPAEFNQCVFIRYYTMRSKWLFPRIIRAGAGPHDLGSGDNRGDAFPELTGKSDSEPATSSDGDLEDQSDLATGCTGSEPNVVVRNTPYVRSSPRPFIVLSDSRL